MATLFLDVPLVAQETDNTCWHASAQMIWWYWQSLTLRQGPMNTLGGYYASDTPVQPADFIPLARSVGMKSVPCSRIYTNQILHGLLKTYGPLWCAGFWYGFGHIIVLTGVDGSSIFLNDPDGGVEKMERIAWFNTKLSNQLPGCLMCKDPKAY